jgi:hypothetical protein
MRAVFSHMRSVAADPSLTSTMAGDRSSTPSTDVSADALAAAIASLTLTPGSRVVVRTRTTIEVRSPRATPSATVERPVPSADRSLRGDGRPAEATPGPGLPPSPRPPGARPWTMRASTHYGQTRYAGSVQAE